MPTTGPGKHRHLANGKWTTDRDEPHTHAFTETPHPADGLTAAEVAALRALLTEPVPLPPEAPSGYEIRPGTGTIKAALAAGHKQLLLRGGSYRDAFGSVPRVGDGLVTLTAYPGEPVVIDGTGGPYSFIYIGAGSDWRFVGIDFRNFPVRVGDSISQGGQGNGSAVIGLQDGHLELDHSNGYCIPSPQDPLCHGLYAYGTGTGIVRNSRWVDWPGAGLHSYRGAPKWITEASEFTGKRRGALIYSGTASITGGRLAALETEFDLEVNGASVTVSADVQGGAGGAVRRVNT